MWSFRPNQCTVAVASLSECRLEIDVLHAFLFCPTSARGDYPNGEELHTKKC